MGWKSEGEGMHGDDGWRVGGQVDEMFRGGQPLVDIATGQLSPDLRMPQLQRVGNQTRKPANPEP
jgi:hypothetical protein